MKKMKISKIIITVLMGAFSVLFLIPLIWMLSAASKYERDVLDYPIRWIPENWNFINNFQMVWMGNVPFSLFYLNSLKLVVIMTLATLLFSSMAAFSLSKLRYRGRDVAFGVLLSFMIIPPEATLVPRYLLMKWFGLYNTHEGLILMSMFSIYFTFLLRQFMKGIHTDFIQAAQVDGAGYWKVYWQIMLPLSKPILATVAIIKFIWSWNDYQNPLIFLIKRELFPIPLGIKQFRLNEFADNYAVLMMASLSAIVPLLIVFVVMQRQVIKGISLGGVKG